jgi:hypothetical protein
MSALAFDKPLAVGKTQQYTFTVPTTWLGNEVLTSALVESTGVTVDSYSFSGNVVEFYATGLTVGRYKAHLSIDTANRSDCHTGLITVVSC